MLRHTDVTSPPDGGPQAFGRRSPKCKRTLPKGLNMLKPVLVSLIMTTLVAVLAADAFADRLVYVPLGPNGAAGPQASGPIQQVGGVVSQGGPNLGYHGGPSHGNHYPPQMARQYPQMHTPLYPTPVPNVPAHIGGTVVTNPAFAPHEMLYPHEYKAMYPPFFHRVRGAWWWTPFGMESHDKWELQGTEVKVKYRSSFAPFSGFVPPSRW